MTSKERVKKLILFIECQKRAEHDDPYSSLPVSSRVFVAASSAKAAKLKRELLADGVDPELLDMPWKILEDRVYDSVASQLSWR
jgi:hypothetical protein